MSEMNNIEKLIKSLKTQNELMSINEAKTIINTMPSTKAAWIKPTIFSIIGAAIIGIGFFIYGSKKTIHTNTSDTKITKETQTKSQTITIHKDPNLNQNTTLEVAVENNEKTTVEQNTKINQLTQTSSTFTHLKDRENRTQTEDNPIRTRDKSPVENKTINALNIVSGDMEDKQNLAPDSIASDNAPISENFYYNNWEKEEQSFNINPSEGNVITGDEGTLIIIPPDAICDVSQGFEIAIKLKEYYKKEDMLLSQLTTASNHNLLESAGMIEVAAYRDDKKLELCKPITVLFPSNKYEDSSYIGFDGKWDDGHNNINWLPIEGGNRNLDPNILFPNCERPDNQVIRNSLFPHTNTLLLDAPQISRKEIRQDEVLKKIRRRFWFRDSVTSKLYDEVYAGIKYRMKDTMSATAYHNCRILNEKASAMQQMLDKLRGQGNFNPYLLNREIGYIMTDVSNFGNINCDRFTKYKNLDDHTYKIGGSEGIVSSRLVFHEIKSILSGVQTNVDEVTFKNIPEGLDATLIVLKYTESGVEVAHQAIQIGVTPHLTFQNISIAEVPETLKSIIDEIDNPQTVVWQKSDSSSTQQIMDKAIVLTPEELEAFHIYQYDDILLYPNFREKGEVALEYIFRTKSFYSGSLRSGNYKSPEMEDEHPLAIVSPQKIYMKSKDFETIAITSNKYLPVYVKFDHGPAPFSIWWFKSTEQNISKLPIRYQNSCSKHHLTPSQVFDITMPLKTTKGNSKNKATNPITRPYSKSQVIFADNELVEKLGIRIKNNRLKYSKGNGFNSIIFKTEKYFTETIGSLRYTDRYAFNTPPSFITLQDSFYLHINEIVSSGNDKFKTEQYFHAQKLHMIAVNIGKINAEEVIFWYENTKRLNDLITKNDKKKIKAYLATVKSLEMPIPSTNEQNNQIHYDEMQSYKSLASLTVNPVRLTPLQLKALDILQKDGDIYYTQYGSTYAFNFKFTKRHTITNIEEINVNTLAKPFKPSFITDKYGKSYRMRTVNEDIDLDRLIPIYVGTDKEYHLSDYFNDFFHPDCIFWYEPTEEFLAVLPEDIRKQLTYELSLMDKSSEAKPATTDIEETDTVRKNDEPEKCVYLDPCSDITTKLKGVKLYPNPTHAEVTVQITAQDAAQGTLTVNNLAGQALITVQLGDIREGTTIDLSDLPAGIYLVTILTSEGDKITRRVVKE